MARIIKFFHRPIKTFPKKQEEEVKSSKPYNEIIKSDRLKNLDYHLFHTVNPDGSNTMDATTMQVALLMDIRRELQMLNELTQKIEQNTRKTQRIQNPNFLKEIK